MDDDDLAGEQELLHVMMTEMQAVFNRAVADLGLTPDQLEALATKWSQNELFKETGLPWFASALLRQAQAAAEERELERSMVDLLIRLSDPKPHGQA